MLPDAFARRSRLAEPASERGLCNGKIDTTCHLLDFRLDTVLFPVPVELQDRGDANLGDPLLGCTFAAQFSRMHGLFRRDKEPSAMGHSPAIASRNHRLTWSDVSRLMYMRHSPHIQIGAARDNLQHFCFDLEIDWRSLDASDLVLSANGCFNPRPTHGSSHSLLPGWRSRTPPLRQRKRHQRIRIRVVVLVSSARGNHHVLLAGLAAKKG